MVLGYDPNQEHSTTFNHIVSGTLGGAVTRVLISPLDVLKIRFQLQSEVRNLKYRGLVQATWLILREEGATAFWKGHMPAQLLSMVFGGVQFGTFEYFTLVAHGFLPHSRKDTWERMVTHGLCGALASSTATLTAQPLDVLRTRFAAQKEPKLHKSVVKAFFKMIQTEGFLSLWKGLIPSLIQIIPYSGLQFAGRSVLETGWIEAGLKEGVYCEFFCGAGAGLFAKSCVYPLDVIKKRLQVQGFGAATVSTVRSYNGFIHCFKTVLHYEGYTAMYKGFTVAALKSSFTSGLVFLTYFVFRQQLEK